MGEFQTPTDIGNRALQHCGATLMDATLGFTEDSQRAQQVGFAYGKLRRAELRRNTWRFATRRAVLRPIDTNTMLLAPALWVAGTTYFVGSIVADGDGNFWISNTPNNLGNDPQNTNAWEPYFGPMTASLYTDGSYSAGEIVYTAPGNGTSRVFLSLQSANDDVPGTATAWDATAIYSKNQVVTYSSIAYMSLIDLNTNNTPSSAPALWASGTTYSAAASVGGTDGVIYTSVGSGNVGHDPTADDGTYWTNSGVLNPWTTVFVSGTGSVQWLEIGGSGFPDGVGLSTLNIVYPIGAGPSTQDSSRNVFRLPSGFLREAAQNPKGTTPWLGGPSGYVYNDWNFEGNYLISAETGPFVFRFVADVTDVRQMDDLFCEGLAARAGLEVCEPLTQSSAKLQSIASKYQKYMSDARAVNAIETGYDDPPDDDYLTVRR